MKKVSLSIIVLTILLGGGYAVYNYFQKLTPKPEVAQTKEVTPPIQLPEKPEPEPIKRLVLDNPAEPVQLPELEASDSFVLSALTEIVKDKSLIKIFHLEQLIHRIVATIDNLPNDRAPMNQMPIEAAKGKFMILDKAGTTFIDPQNRNRYAPYIKFAKAADPKALVELYVKLYPLLQKDYAELGYPDKYFNDRLLVVIDNLLATPEIKEPVEVVQPKYYYLYADANIESRPIGQRILMRIGSENEALIKTKLKEIKEELKLHLHEIKAESPT